MCCLSQSAAGSDLQGSPAAFGRGFPRSGRQRESKIKDGQLMPAYVHILLSILPKYAVSQVIGFMKGKSAIHLARVYGSGSRILSAKLLGARYLVSMVGRDESVIREYIRNQEVEDERLDQLNLWK